MSADDTSGRDSWAMEEQDCYEDNVDEEVEILLQLGCPEPAKRNESLEPPVEMEPPGEMEPPVEMEPPCEMADAALARRDESVARRRQPPDAGLLPPPCRFVRQTRRPGTPVPAQAARGPLVVSAVYPNLRAHELPTRTVRWGRKRAGPGWEEPAGEGKRPRRSRGNAVKARALVGSVAYI